MITTSASDHLFWNIKIVTRKNSWIWFIVTIVLLIHSTKF